jgi:hypothetical protein
LSITLANLTKPIALRRRHVVQSSRFEGETMNRRTAIRLFAGAAAAAVVARQAQRRARLLRTQGRIVRDDFVAKYPVRRRFVTVAGCRTHVYVAGPKESDRPPLLLLHGGVVEAASWMEAVTALCADRLVIAPDLPAHGASGYLPPSQLLDWLEAFVDHSDLHNFDLCGHSMGGGLAIRYAAQHGDRVRRLSLCAPPALLNICRTRAYISSPHSATCRRSNRRTNSTR